MSRKKTIIIIYVFLLIFLYLIIYVLPNLIVSLKSSYAVQYGEIEVSQNANGLIVREENVYTATSSGKANYLIGDDDLVRVGTKIIDLEGGKKEADEELLKLSKKVKAVSVPTGDYTAQYDGLVAYYCDGYESKIRPESIDKISEDTVKSIEDKSAVNLKRREIAAKEPAFKIVNRSHWNLVCFLKSNPNIVYTEGKGIRVVIEGAGGKSSLLMTVDSVFKNKKTGKTKLVLTSDRYYNGMTSDRKVKVTLVDSINKGLVIKNTSIISNKKGQKGVMVKNKVGDFVFKPISIIVTDGENSVVANKVFFDKNGKAVDTIVTYDIILTRP